LPVPASRLADGRSAWGGAAELMAPKWFDKNLALSNDDNFEQLRSVLRMARDAVPVGRQSPDTAFGHFARHHDRAPGRQPPRASSTRCSRATVRR
jgi:hypothetical protein